VGGCGGTIFLHDSFDFTFATDLVNLLSFVVGSDGHLSVASSSGVRVARVIGHVCEENDKESTKGRQLASSSHPSVNVCQLQLTSCRADHAVSIYFEQPDIPHDFVYFQFVVSSLPFFLSFLVLGVGGWRLPLGRCT